jgi:hypothetical protein
MLEEPQTAPESLPTRKRSKASEENDEDRSKKRSRGRPRLDTRDETAQDVSSSNEPSSPLTLGLILTNNFHSVVERRFDWLKGPIVIAKILPLRPLRTKSRILKMPMKT